MNNIGILMKYEWKKLLGKRLVRATLLVLIGIQIFACVRFLMDSDTVYYTDSEGNNICADDSSGYEMMIAEREYARALDGRVIDEAFLRDMQQSNDLNIRKISKPYGAVFTLVRATVGAAAIYGAGAPLTEQEFYDAWRNGFSNIFAAEYLREDETAYWTASVRKLETPFTFRYHTMWEKLFTHAAVISILVLMAVAICLSSMFSEERRRKTDQQVRCTRNGRTQVYIAKMAVGICAGMSFATLLYLLSFGIDALIWGTDGFRADIRFFIPYVPYQLSVGQAVLILWALTLLAAALFGVTALVLSELLDNGMAVMAVLIGVMLLSGLLNIPEHFRLLSQICSYIPTRLIAEESFTDMRLVKLFGQYMTNFQFAAVLYPVLSALLLLVGYLRYKNCEVSG